MREKIYAVRGQIRAVLWIAVVLGVLVNILSTISDGFGRRQIIPLLIALAVAGAAEAAIFVSKSAPTALFAPSQIDLLRRIPEFHTLVSEATELLLLGGTMKTLTDDARTVEAIHGAVKAGKSVRILLMHPHGEGVTSTARARKTAGKSVTEADLRSEIKTSIARLIDCCGPGVQHSIRLYREHPTYSMHCFGSRWVLTVYTLGRGASSPALFFTESAATSEFARGLRKGFDELWGAPTTSTLDWPASVV